jgi:hypothetical protein
MNKKFIHMDHVENAILTALDLKKNLLLFGPGGHGKSELVAQVLSDLSIKPFVQFFGEGMTEDRLYGGVCFKTLEEEKRITYNTDLSFVNHEVVVFEELLDAPAVVLTALKDALSSKIVRNGHQQVPVKTRTVIACTNKSPSEMVDHGPSVMALLERFALEVEVTWPSYGAKDYVDLFKATYSNCQEGAVWPLATLLAKSPARISPRVALAAYDCWVKGSWEDLSFVAGLGYSREDLQAARESIEHEARANRQALEERERAQAQIRYLREHYSNIMLECNGPSYSTHCSPIAALKIVKRTKQLLREATEFRMHDELMDDFRSLVQRLERLQTMAMEQAINWTKLS